MKKLILLFFTSLLCISHSSAQSKAVIDLSDRNTVSITIQDKTSKLPKEGKCFQIHLDEKKDSIQIRKIILAKNNTQKDTLKILVNKEVKKTTPVMNDIPTSFFIKNKDVIIIHWGKNSSWTIKVTKKMIDQKTATSIANNITKPKDSIKYEVNPKQKNEDSCSNIVFWCIAFFVLGCILGWLAKYFILYHKSIKGVNISPSNTVTSEENRLEKEYKQIGSDDKDSLNDNSEEEVNIKDSQDDNHSPEETNIISERSTIQQKCEVSEYEGDDEALSSDTNSYSNTNCDNDILQDYKSIKDILYKEQINIDDSLEKTIEKIIHENQELKQNAEIEEKRNINVQDDYIPFKEVMEIINRNDKIKNVYDDETNGNNKERISFLFQLLNKKLNNSLDKRNVYEANKFVIERLTGNGLGEYFKCNNTKLIDGINAILADLESSNEASNPKKDIQLETTEEDIIRKVCSNIPTLPVNLKTIEGLRAAILNLSNQAINISTKSKEEQVDNKIDAFIFFLRQFKGLNTVDIEKATEQLKFAWEKSKTADDICKQYNVDDIKKLADAIKEQDLNSIKGNLSSDTLEIVKNSLTINKLVSELDEAYIKANKIKSAVNIQMEEALINLQIAYKELSGNDIKTDKLSDVFTAYKQIIEQNKIDKENEITSLKTENQKQKVIITDNEKMQNERLGKIKLSIEMALNCIEETVSKTFIRPCDTNLRTQCNQNQNLLREATKTFDEKMREVLIDNNIEKVSSNMHNVIMDDINNERGLINTLSRFYAYSCLPFMTDATRDFGMRFDHSAMLKAFSSINSLTANSGIQLIVPNLFEDRITDGDYQDCTGESYGDLENMCPGIANYVQEISNSDKTNYIIDLVQVGYRINNKSGKDAKVIIM